MTATFSAGTRGGIQARRAFNGFLSLFLEDRACYQVLFFDNLPIQLGFTRGGAFSGLAHVAAEGLCRVAVCAYSTVPKLVMRVTRGIRNGAHGGGGYEG